MSVNPLRPLAYRSANDLKRAQAALMRWVNRVGQCCYLHKGDIGHRLFNGCYGYDKADVFRYWVDDAGEVGAFVLLYPHWASFDLQVAPSLFRGDSHADLIRYCEDETLRLGQKYRKTIKEWVIEVPDCDSAHQDFLAACGYSRSKHWFTLTRRQLDTFPDVALPPDFHFHDASAADVEALADVHNHSFTNKWNADSYGEVFRSPHLEYEIVVVAPDGRFAAFTNVWIDDVNRSLLFEPVGTHSDFRRRGLGKALMVYALKRMKAEHDLVCAYVCHEPAEKNPASGALYASVGFQELHKIHEYVKRLT
ncbi:MAG: GNAT family N-acetyltransferase [Chloroflexi bacterium]|nr:GNAT family N-acetyltransferase [Chloroflexota bacterium]